MLSCNKKGLSHSNWTVHLEPCWCKKSLTEKSITICVEHGHDFQRTFFFRFLNSSFSPPSSPAVGLLFALCSISLYALSRSCVSCIYFPPPSRLSLLSIYFCFMCSKKYSLPSHQKILAWNTLLIEKSGRGKKKKKKISPVSLAWPPIQLFCLPLCFLIMLGLNTPGHLNQCLMLCCHCVHTFLTSLGSHCQDQWT